MQRSQLSAHYARVRRKIFRFFCGQGIDGTNCSKSLRFS
nr:MAG TPA: hypothetical protein [Caudoviricetes sp.]